MAQSVLPSHPDAGPPSRGPRARRKAAPKIDEAAIRAALLRYLERAARGRPETLIVEELGLCEGAGRVDVAVISDTLSGYEIKSDYDTFGRLPHQRRIYARVLDRVTLVVGPRHLAAARRRAPRWWGILCAVPGEMTDSAATKQESLDERPSSPAQSLVLRLVRAPGWNPAPDAYATAQLLWRDEALRILGTRGLAKGLASAARKRLWQTLVDELSPSDLRAVVCTALKAREGWRRPQQGARHAQEVGEADTGHSLDT